MTERSYFHDGAAYNDGQYAPYTPNEFARITNLLHATSGKYVLPGVLNDLEVTAVAASKTVQVDTGSAFIEGYWYQNDAVVTITIANNTADYGRWDRIIVEIDTEEETAEATVIQGAPGAVPDPPPLNTCDTILQLPLARVYVPASFAAVQSYYVHDERHFANNAYHQNFHSTDNNFPNHRFVGWGDSQNSTEKTGTVRQAMPGWEPVAAGGSEIRAAQPFDTMNWGRCAYNYYSADRDYGWETILLTNENAATMTTLRFLIQVDVGVVDISFAGVTYSVPPCASPQEVIIRGEFSGYQTLSITNDSPNALTWAEEDCLFTFGDFRLSQGYVVASEFTNYDQYIFYNEPMYNDKVEKAYPEPVTLTGLSDGTLILWWPVWGTDDDEEDIRLTSTSIPKQYVGIKGYVLDVRINDSTSSAQNVFASFMVTASSRYLFQPYISGVSNDEPRWHTGLIRIDHPLYWFSLLDVDAGGAGTLDLEIGIVGVVL